MADSEVKNCPCSNITIMQLFHELKQKFPKIPDHVVSKVMEQNFHDKTSCETILQRESHHYLQSYPGALISGIVRNQIEPLSKQCSAQKKSQSHRFSSVTKNVETLEHCTDSGGSGNQITPVSKNLVKSIFCHNDGDSNQNSDNLAIVTSSDNQVSHSESPRKENTLLVTYSDSPDSSFTCNEVPKNELIDNLNIDKDVNKNLSAENDLDNAELNEDHILTTSSSSLGTCLGSFTDEREEKDRSSESSAVFMDKTSESGCDSDSKEYLVRFQSSLRSSSPKGVRERDTQKLFVEDCGRKSAILSGVFSHSSSTESPVTHNYQVALECTMLPIPCLLNRDHTRSFTSVNLSLRPPSSEPQPPIEIQSGQGLTYTTSLFNPDKGYQSQLQIKIGPGGGGTFSACRTYISTPQFKSSSSACLHCSYHFPGSHSCENKNLRELLEKQKEQKDLLARELRREKEKLRSMRNEVRLMQAAFDKRPNPHILPKLRAEIQRLRTECERLTAAVDLYSDNQSNLPLGETNEEFYENIYTGQRFQREGSWSCQLCTFRNHPLLNVCEECEMPRLSIGTAVKDVTSCLSNVFSNNSNASFCTGAGTSASASLITAPLPER